MNILDILFPRYCVNCKKFGDFLCPNCFSRLSFDTKNICLVCGKPSYDGITHPVCKGRNRIDGSFTGVVFNGISKKLIYQFKYKPYLSSLSFFLTDLLYESLIQNEEFNRILSLSKNDIIFVPIPLSAAKLRKRGYNQAEILAKGLSKKFGLEVCNCLERIKETRSQVGLSKKERKENVAGAFAVRGPVLDFPPAHSASSGQASARNAVYPESDRRVGSPSSSATPHFSIRGKNIILVDDVLTTGSTFSEASSILKRSGANKVWAVAFAREQ